MAATKKATSGKLNPLQLLTYISNYLIAMNKKGHISQNEVGLLRLCSLTVISWDRCRKLVAALLSGGGGGERGWAGHATVTMPACRKVACVICHSTTTFGDYAITFTFSVDIIFLRPNKSSETPIFFVVSVVVLANSVIQECLKEHGIIYRYTSSHEFLLYTLHWWMFRFDAMKAEDPKL